MAEKLVVTVEEMGRMLGISRGTASESVRNGTIPSLRVGKRWLVPVKALERLLETAEKPINGRSSD